MEGTADGLIDWRTGGGWKDCNTADWICWWLDLSTDCQPIVRVRPATQTYCRNVIETMPCRGRPPPISGPASANRSAIRPASSRRRYPGNRAAIDFPSAGLVSRANRNVGAAPIDPAVNDPPPTAPHPPPPPLLPVPPPPPHPPTPPHPPHPPGGFMSV